MDQDTVLDKMIPNEGYTKLELTRHIHNDKTITSLSTKYHAINKIVTRLCKYKCVVRTYKDKTPKYTKIEDL